MSDYKGELWTYHVKFTVDGAHYGLIVQACGKDMVKKLLEKQYPNCEVVVREEDIEELEYQKTGEGK